MSSGTIQAAPRREFATLMDGARERIAAVLPPGIDPERFRQTVISAYYREPELQTCTAESLIKGAIKAAEIGLVPNTAHAHCYLMPFSNKQRDGTWKREAQLVMGVKGYIHLACHSNGFFRAVDARVVRSKDQFELYYDPSPKMRHIPYLGEGDSGPETHWYAYGVTRSGEILVEVMTRREVEAIRDATVREGRQPSPAWRVFLGEMGNKCALKRLLKDQPKSDALARAFEADDEPLRHAQVQAVEPTPKRGDAILGAVRRPAAVEHDPDYAEADSTPPPEPREPGSDG